MTRRDLLVCVVVAGVAVAMSLAVTRHGVAKDTDSSVYLATAQNLLDGRGVTTPFQAFTSEYAPRAAAEFRGALPLTHYPPLYPLTLAAIGATGVPLDVAARALGAALLGVNLLLLAALARRALPSLRITVGVVVLASIGPVAGHALGPHHSWLYVHGQAMSEPLFITLSLGALLALERHLATDDHRVLLIAGSLAGLATATRFMGVGLILTGVALLLPRWRRTAAFVAVSALPIVLWTVASKLWFGTGAPRSLHVSDPRLRDLVAIPEGWLGVTGLSPSIRHVIVAGVLGLSWAAVRRGPQRVLKMLGLYIMAITITVVLTRAFLDLSTPFDDRVFAPVQGPFYVLVLGAMAEWRGQAMRLAMRLAMPIVTLTLIALGLPAALTLLREGPPGDAPAEAVFAVAARELPPDALLATNLPTRLWDVEGLPSINVPSRITAVTLEPNPHFDEEVDELIELIRQRSGYIVLLGPEKMGFVGPLFPTEEDLLRDGSLRVVRRTSDGVILGAA